ncbi:DNA-binding transcriptional LysR family regulator [Scopulibacillus darangshiensis]|uniref:DNA-binding transcriptional LysR family regulator n=1 Tax=Scopulibacillus darangshiensis TaxID=442528 RepID=A0A4V2SKJ0_9BACL|nr:LysR family transcriptional regulator [Scopulibacillus darangshiensis]TCP19696.1 DNA-binding transcriptional LysR family regulator [Scopulibacillus darangshiensis]
MEIRQLMTFRTVAFTLNFTRAAEALNYVPSNVTMQMQSLEEELGTQLIDRLGKQIALTDAGKRFLLHAEKVLNSVDEARLAMKENEELTGTLTISANEIPSSYRLPAVLQSFRARYPGIRLIFRPFANEQLKQSLYEGKTDIVFMLDESVGSTNLMIEPLIEEPFLFLVAPDHPLVQRTYLRSEDFQGEPFLLTEKGCPYRTLFDRTIKQQGIHESMTNLEFSSAETIKQCAMAGIGIAFLPKIAVKAELERGELISLPWEMPNLQIVTQMVWHKDKWLSPAIKAFLELTREVITSK